MVEVDRTLKEKYRSEIRKLLHRTGVDPPGGTWVCVIGLSSKRARTGGNSGDGKKKTDITVKGRMKAYWGSVSR